MARESSVIMTISRIVESFLMLLGLSCNSVVLVSFARCSYLLKSESNLLILVLSMCDVLHIIVATPCNVMLQYARPHNLYGCLVLLSSISLPMQLSISTLFSMSVISFLSLRCPMLYARYVTKRRVITFTLLQMAISCVVDFIPLFGWRRPWNYDRPLCTFQKVQYFTYRVYVLFIGTVVLRLVIMTAIYAYIFYVVAKQSRSIADMSVDTRFIAERARFRTNLLVARRFSIIIVVFTVCMTPTEIFNALELWTGWVCFDCKRAMSWLVTMHGCVTPLLYAYNSPSLRHCMKRTVKCSTIDKSEVVSAISSV